MRESGDEAQSDTRNIHERVSYHSSVISVCNCQISSEVNNRTYLSATAHVKSTAFLGLHYLYENLTVHNHERFYVPCVITQYCTSTITDYLRTLWSREMTVAMYDFR